MLHLRDVYVLVIEAIYEKKTSLLRRLQAQTLPNATPAIGKISPVSKITITFEPLMGF